MSSSRVRRALSVVGAAALLPIFLSPVRADAAGTWQFKDGITNTSVVAGSQYAKVTTDGGTWAVGEENVRTGGGLAVRSVLAHWTGSTWQHLSTPPAPSGAVDPTLNSIRVLAANNVWVSGYATYTASTDQGGFVAHSDGHHWYVHGLGSGTAIGHLAAFSTSDVWALGEANVYTHRTAASWHFNGSAWLGASLPAAADGLDSISTTSPAWATGTDLTTGKSRLLHYNGHAWSRFTAPAITLPSGAHSYHFNDVLQTSASSVWVTVGYGGTEGLAPGLGLWQWDGAVWHHKRQLSNEAPAGIASGYLTGSVWLLSGGLTVHPHLVDFAPNGAVSTVAPPAYKGVTMDIGSLARIPGSTALWGVGDLNSNGTTTAAIARYSG